MAIKRDNVCKFCKKGFSTESVLSNHMCVKKKRYADRDIAGCKIGFRVFQMFHKANTTSVKEKTLEEFIDSKLYLAFVKFGRYFSDLKPIHGEQFIFFLIDRSIKMNLWVNQDVYNLYVESVIYVECPQNAIERSIMSMVKWSEMSGKSYADYFRECPCGDLTHSIKTGKISPWVIYLSESGSGVFDRLSVEQYSIIENIVNPEKWGKILDKEPRDDMDFYQNLLHGAGL